MRISGEGIIALIIVSFGVAGIISPWGWITWATFWLLIYVVFFLYMRFWRKNV